MKTKTAVLTALLTVFSVFALGSSAPKSQSQAQSHESAMPNTAMANCMGHGITTSGGMMGSGMIGHAMMGQQHSGQKLIDRLTADLAAAKSEVSSAAVKSKLDDANSVIAQLRGELPQEGMGMHNMTGNMKNCPAMPSQQNKK